MRNYMDLKFSWYNKGIKSVVPAGDITLRQFVNAIKNPKEKMREAFKDIEQAAINGNLKLKDKLKQDSLFFTTPSVRCSYRDYANIKEFLPFVVLEYDKIKYAEVLKEYVFNKFQSCIFAFLSPSKTGAKFIFLLEKAPKNVDEYKDYYFGIAHHLDKFAGFDYSNCRCVLPLFNSWDEEALLRENAVGSDLKGYKEDTFDIPENIPEAKGEHTNKEKRRCEKLIKTLIDRIDDNGHNQVLSASFIAGGLSMFYGLEELWDVLQDRIIENEYLSKGTSNYLRTATQMFTKGTSYPTSLKD
jgi:hypothetical protein